MTETDDRPTLLVVDEDATFARVLADAFDKRGFAVLLAHNVAEGLAAANEESPEYAVVDLKMPGPSGLELVARLKELDENTRIVVLTGYASVATAVEAIKLGAIHHLDHPRAFRQLELIRRLAFDARRWPHAQLDQRVRIVARLDRFARQDR